MYNACDSCVSGILSPHEAYVTDPLAAEAFRGSRPRIAAIIETFDGVEPMLDSQRGLYFTRSMRATEGRPLVWRWAKALLHVAENISVHIDPHQLLAGRIGKSPRYGIMYPEVEGDFYATALDHLGARETSKGGISQEDREIALREIAPYWQGKTYHERFNKALLPEVRALLFQDSAGIQPRYIVNESSSFRSSLQWVHDYQCAIERGFLDIQREAREKLERLDPDDPAQMNAIRPFYEAIIMVSDAIMLWAGRHADLAESMAEKEPDATRRQELLELARICRRVPALPARTFHEALQCQWFVQLFSRLEQRTGTTISNGRMDQYLYPYYAADLAAGRITQDRAVELLECLWTGMAQFVEMYIMPQGNAFTQGYAHWEAVTIGGQTRDGRDATNRLSHLILQSKRELPLHYPDLAARVHGRSPEAFLWDVAETVKFGTGHPKLLNDEEIIPLLTAKGARMEEALDYAASGCTEVRMPNTDTLTSSCARINLAAALEMVFYRGRMLKYGEELLGVDTGDPAALKDWNAFFNAYISQIHHCLRIAFASQYVINKLREHCFAQPMGSSLHKLCMKHGLDLHSEHIPEGLELGFVDFIGFGTVIDSLSAIKMHIYEEKSITMTELVTALRENFSGHEALRALLQNSPRYGNNQEYADSLGKALEKAAMEYCDKHSAALEMPVDIRYVPVTAHVPFGRVVAASPNGRLAWTPLSDGTSPSPGADVNGPTGVLLSNAASKNYGSIRRAARMLNMKFSPQAVAGDRGTENLVQLFRTFVDLKLWHVQFNIINRETLLHAKAEPEKFKNLIVRVAGYSAYFVDLSPDMQDDIIARTEHETV
ncbi:pyruvate formate lyase family protein [uncultured Desulfovibrio sp.]|uniref:(2S)-3-sulfopropanediol dehydratase n=5 Tax=uncultured Desulfovibrio sp. TaxID=167968 RepID=UPI0025EB0742|nr:pyruvate formate lyase family protein [uncultured Desulfovibrio sp.]